MVENNLIVLSLVRNIFHKSTILHGITNFNNALLLIIKKLREKKRKRLANLISLYLKNEVL